MNDLQAKFAMTLVVVAFFFAYAIPTMRQARKAPAVTLRPRMVSAAHRSAWASMPTATGQGNIFNGMEKKMP